MTGVIPRWQLVAVYFFITLVFAVTAVWSHNAAREASRAVTAVQAQRFESIRTSCEAQNARHNAVVGAINQQILISIVNSPNNKGIFKRATNHARLRELAKQAQGVKDPGKDHKRLASLAAEAKSYLAPRDQKLYQQGYAQTFALLNAGAPQQNCKVLVHHSVKPVKTVP